MPVNSRWRLTALVALLLLGAWVVLSTYAFLDAGLQFDPVFLIAAAFVLLAGTGRIFAFPPVLAACAGGRSRHSQGCRAPPRDFLRA